MLTDRSWTPALVASTKLEKGMRAMAKLSEGQRHHVDAILDRMDEAYDELVHCTHDLEDCGCKAQMKKLDTIVGKLENVMYELYDKANN